MGTLIGNLNPEILGITTVNSSSLLVRSNNKLSSLTKTNNKSINFPLLCPFRIYELEKRMAIKSLYLARIR